MDKSISAELDRQAADKLENPELYCIWPGCLVNIGERRWSESRCCDEHRMKADATRIPAPDNARQGHEYRNPGDSGELDDFRDHYFTRDW